jgi:hypothetical protein
VVNTAIYIEILRLANSGSKIAALRNQGSRAVKLRETPLDQAERSRRWREGVALRLDEIRAELAQLGAQIDQKLTALADRLAEPDRQAGRGQ